MRVLWEIFEISVNLYQGFVMAYFSYSFLEDKKNRPFLKSPGIFYGLLLMILISVMNYLTIFEGFYSLIYFIILFIYAEFSLRGTILTKAFASIFSNLIMAIASAFMGNLAAVVFKTDFYTILSHNDFKRLISVIATQIVILYFVLLSLRILKTGKRKQNELAITEWLLISLILMISIIIGALLNFISLSSTSQTSGIYTVMCFIGIILINIIVCYIVIELGRKNKAIRENEMLKLTREYNRQYIENANIEYDAIRKLRHDFKDNYRVIYTLLAEGKPDKAMNHIENIQSNLIGTEVFVRTDNDIANAVINSRLSSAKSFGIESTCLSVTSFNGIDDLDLCRLLSNMLENAVTACLDSKNASKNIYLKIVSDDYSYTFNLKNTIDTSVLKHNPKLKTTKSNIDEHGLGTKIIEEIARKYEGKCDFYEEDGLFCCNVVLMKQ